jgi:hypothetical protein
MTGPTRGFAGKVMCMLPYAATDVVRVMQDEFRTDDEYRFGAYLARDVRRDEDNDVADSNRPDRGERHVLRLSFLLGTVLSRAA